MARRPAFPAGRRYLAAMGGIVLGGLLFANGITNGEADAGKAFRQGPAVLAATDLGLDMTTTSTVTSGLFGSVAFPFKPGALMRWKQIETAAAGLSPQDCGEQATCRTRMKMLRETVEAVNGGVKTGHGAEQKSATLARA